MNLVSWNLIPTEHEIVSQMLVKSIFKNEIFLRWDECTVNSIDTLCFISTNQLEEWYKLPSSNRMCFITIGGTSLDIDSPFYLGTLSHTMLEKLDHAELKTIVDAFLSRFNYHQLELEVDLMSFELDKMREQITSELGAIKKIYQKIVPIRSETLSALQISSKFSSGLKGGGEYFDWSANRSKLFFYLFTTSSYTLTGELVQLFANVLQEGNFSSDRSNLLLENIDQTYNAFQSKKDAELDFIFFTIDLKSLRLDGHSFGKHSFFTGQGEFIDQHKERSSFAVAKTKTSFSHQSDKGEIMFLESAGIQKSKTELLKDKSILDLKKITQQTTREYFDSELIALQSAANSDFLPYDSTLIKIEVLKNGIFKV